MRHGQHGKPVVVVRSGEAQSVVVHSACRALRKKGKTRQAKEVEDSHNVDTAAQFVQFDGFDDLTQKEDLP